MTVVIRDIPIPEVAQVTGFTPEIIRVYRKRYGLGEKRGSRWYFSVEEIRGIMGRKIKNLLA